MLTVSYRFHTRIPVIKPSSEFLIQLVCIAVRAVFVDLDFRNPCWLSGSRPLSSMNLVIWWQTIFSRTMEAATRFDRVFFLWLTVYQSQIYLNFLMSPLRLHSEKRSRVKKINFFFVFFSFYKIFILASFTGNSTTVRILLPVIHPHHKIQLAMR